MKTKLIKKKKNKYVGAILLTLTAFGGICAILANRLQKKRKKLSAKADKPLTDFHPSGHTVAGGCQKMGQNEANPEKTDIDCTSSEWERGIL